MAGGIALALAMGIGRFAFTPLMPLMLRDGTMDAGNGALWAAANYIGYLVGALTSSRFAANPQRGLSLGLLGVAVTTLAVAWTGGDAWPAGAALRAVTGVFSAWVLVCATSWCLGALARHHALHLGGWIYTGVGVGIALTGIITWLGGQQTASALWIELGLLAAVGALYPLRRIRQQPVTSPQGASGQPAAGAKPAPAMTRRDVLLVLCYGTFGFGYIVPATYLPTMARQLVSDPLVFGLTWPVFGLAAALSVAMVSRWLSGWPRQRVWALGQGVMAVGTLLPLLQQSILVLVTSAVLVGGTFMVTTMAGLQQARERAPSNPTPLLSRMTASFATGQILGPLLVRAIGPQPIGPWDALGWASLLATVLLAVSAAWLWQGVRARTA